MSNKTNFRFYIFFTLAFVVFTAIGTVSHEYGHILVAKLLGYKTTLHYGSMNYNSNEQHEKLIEILIQNDSAIRNNEDFAQKAEYERLLENRRFNSLLVSMGGPFQTILTGTLGLVFLVWRKKEMQRNGMHALDWLAAFLSLFWLREVFNLVMSIGKEIIAPNGTWFGGDELHIAERLNVWPGTFAVPLGVIGLMVSLYVVFKVVPKNVRLAFITSGLVGGIAGFLLWMDVVGPIILP